MKFLAASTLLASIAVAAPSCPAPNNTELPAQLGTPLWAMTLASATPLHYQKLSADGRSLLVTMNSFEQRAKCESGDNENHATLVVYNGELHLYSLGVRQQIYIDNEDAGRGLRRVGFDTGYIPTGVKLDGWSIDGDKLLHNEAGILVACAEDPKTADAWKVYVQSNKGGPVAAEGTCYGFTPRMTEVADPVSCRYE